MLGILSAPDLLLIRYGVPALLLSPILFKHGLIPTGISHQRLGIAVALGGATYGLCAMIGARYAPVAHMGALIPGTVPIFVTLLVWFLFGSKPTLKSTLGLAVLLVGALLVAFESGAQFSLGTLGGDAMFLGAALVWAGYTCALRGQNVSVWHLSALISAVSAFAALLLWLIASDTQIWTAKPATLFGVVMIQGVLAGVFGNVFFLLSVKHLGAVVASGTGALVPAFTALGGVVILRESLSARAMVGVALTVIGIWLVQIWAKR